MLKTPRYTNTDAVHVSTLMPYIVHRPSFIWWGHALHTRHDDQISV